MSQSKKLYRSRNALIGGVCAGLAEYFDLDAIVVRVFFVVSMLISASFFGVVYIALCLIIPKAPKSPSVMEVDAESVQSEWKGRVVEPSSHQPKDVSMSIPSSGHIPPKPPPFMRGFEHQTIHSRSVVVTSQSFESSGAQNEASIDKKKIRSEVYIRLVLGFAVLLLYIGASILFSGVVYEAEGLQFWPCFLVILAFMIIVLPPLPNCQRWGTFSAGIALGATGMALLPCSIGLITWSSFIIIFENLWPVLIIAAGFWIMYRSVRVGPLALCAAVAVCIFTLGGIVWFGEPGNIATLTVNLFGHVFYIDSPWWLMT